MNDLPPDVPPASTPPPPPASLWPDRPRTPPSTEPYVYPPPTASLPDTGTSTGGVPPDYKTAGVFMLVGGLTTAMMSLVCIGLLIWFCGLGLLWVPLLASGVASIVCAAQAMNGTRVRSLRLVNAFGLVAAVFSGDLIGIVFQVLALVWLARDDVARWIDGGDRVASRPA